MKKWKKVSFLNRSGFLYIVILIILLSAVNLRGLEERYARELWGAFATENYEDYRAGALYYESLTRLYPAEAEFFAKLGICYYKLGEQKKAVAAYSRAIALDARYNQARVKF